MPRSREATTARACKLIIKTSSDDGAYRRAIVLGVRQFSKGVNADAIVSWVTLQSRPYSCACEFPGLSSSTGEQVLQPNRSWSVRELWRSALVACGDAGAAVCAHNLPVCLVEGADFRGHIVDRPIELAERLLWPDEMRLRR